MAKVVFHTDEVLKKVDKKATLFIRKIALDGLSQLIRQSPVDTGRFKANWSTSVGKLGTETTDKTISNVARQAQGIAKYKLNSKMYLYNNLQYVLSLEMGTSQQAPKGWVRNTAIVMQKKLNEIKGLI